MEWEFQAPKFWDLSETIPQQRPSDSWFRPENVSNPSFEAPKKRRTLRIFKYSSTSAAKKKLQEPIQKRESVFERLSRESTISFSRKTNQPLTPHQRQLEAHHSILNDYLEENNDSELIVQSSKETVGERIARLEGTYLDEKKPFGSEKKPLKLKQNIDHSSYGQRTLDEETEGAFNTKRLSPPQIEITPTRESTSVSHRFSREERTQTKASSPHIPIQSASPIRKRTSKPNHAIHPVVDKVVSNFFEGLLKLAAEREKKAQQAKEAKAKAFFENLLVQNTSRRRAEPVGTYFESTESLSSFSPRKRKVSTGKSDYDVRHSFKRTRSDVDDL